MSFSCCKRFFPESIPSQESPLPFFPDRNELFHSKNGARKSSKKILIVITDGKKYKDSLEYRDVIPLAEKAGIIRYAIGVRHLARLPAPRLPGLRAPAQADRLLGSFSSPASLLQVGGAFQESSTRQELDAIGSVPSQDHVFKVDNFAALGSIQKQLQEKIFAVEGNWGTGLGTEDVPPQWSPQT